MSLGMVGTENEIKKLLKGFSDYSGFSTVANDIGRLFGKQGSGYSGIKDYLHRLGLYDSESSVNSAITENNNSSMISINDDGSASYNGVNLNNLDELGIVVLEALIGGIPELQRMWSSAENQKARDWETQMSNTAYQRSMADMKAAGLNPILAYSQGGANVTSSPITSGSSSASSLGNSLDGISKIIKTVMKEDRKDDVQATKLVEKYSPSNSARTMHVKLRK